MDQNAPTVSKPQSKEVYKPILISIILMASCFIVLLAYRFLIVKYMRWRRWNSVPPPHTVAGTSVGGIEQKLLDSIPIVIYSVQNRRTFCLDQTECAVCLGELEEVDMVRVLPPCKHVFHVLCIDQWLKRHVSCPLCRSHVSAPRAVTVIEFPTDVSGGVDVVGEDSDSRLTMGRTRVSMMRHCASMVFGRERTNKGLLEKDLKRSMSMDHFVQRTESQISSFELV